MINWLINYPQADNSRDTARFRRNPHAPVLVSCDSVFPARLGVFDIYKYTFMFLLQTKIPNMPSSDVSWEWKHGRVLQIIYAKLVAPLSFMIRSYRTHNPSVVSRDISYQWNEYTLHKRDLTLFLERFDFSQSFLSLNVHFLHRPVCMHITSTDQAIKATQFAVNRGCI